MGKGHRARPMSPVGHRNQPGLFLSRTIPVRAVSRHGTQEPNFEGFSGSGVGFGPSSTNRRFSVLQQTIGHFVEDPARSSLLP